MPKIGDALKRAVEIKQREPEGPGRRAKSSSALMNSNRRALFKQLCLRPCTDAGQLSKALGLSRASVKWHLDVLADSGYVQDIIIGESSAYCPTGLVSLGNMPLLWVLARDDNEAVYSAILRNPGSGPGEISSGTGISPARVRNSLSALREFGLVTVVKDGRHARYFPTRILEGIISRERKVRREFQRTLIDKLSAEHLSPEVVELKGANIVITVAVLGQKDRIEIPTEPCAGLSSGA